VSPPPPTPRSAPRSPSSPPPFWRRGPAMTVSRALFFMKPSPMPQISQSSATMVTVNNPVLPVIYGRASPPLFFFQDAHPFARSGHRLRDFPEVLRIDWPRAPIFRSLAGALFCPKSVPSPLFETERLLSSFLCLSCPFLGSVSLPPFPVGAIELKIPALPACYRPFCLHFFPGALLVPCHPPPPPPPPVLLLAVV